MVDPEKEDVCCSPSKSAHCVFSQFLLMQEDGTVVFQEEGMVCNGTRCIFLKKDWKAKLTTHDILGTLDHPSLRLESFAVDRCVHVLHAKKDFT